VLVCEQCVCIAHKPLHMWKEIYMYEKRPISLQKYKLKTVWRMCIQYVSSVLVCDQRVCTAHKPLPIEKRSICMKRDLYRFRNTNWKQYEGCVFSMWAVCWYVTNVRVLRINPYTLKKDLHACRETNIASKIKIKNITNDIHLVCEQCASNWAICVCCTYIPTHWEEIYTYEKRHISLPK